MKIVKKLMMGALLSASSVMSAHAIPINMGGGVYVDPDYFQSLNAHDFIGQFNFTQWYTLGNQATTDKLSTTNLTHAAVVASGVSQNGNGAATGYFLQGAGTFYRVNEPSRSIAAGFGLPGSFCPGCQLTFAFGGIELNNNFSFNYANAWGAIYVDRTSEAPYSVPSSSNPATYQADLDAHTDGEPWLRFKFNALGFAPNSTPSVVQGSVAADLEVIGGIAAPYFNPKFVSYTADANFGASEFSAYGNGRITGNTVPEPTSLAMLGLGLLGLAAGRRKKSFAVTA